MPFYPRWIITRLSAVTGDPRHAHILQRKPDGLRDDESPPDDPSAPRWPLNLPAEWESDLAPETPDDPAQCAACIEWFGTLAAGTDAMTWPIEVRQQHVRDAYRLITQLERRHNWPPRLHAPRESTNHRDAAEVLHALARDVQSARPTVPRPQSLQSLPYMAPEPSVDGPEPPNGFRWKGVVIDITFGKTEWRLIEHLWHSREHKSSIADTCDSTWGHDQIEKADNALPAAIRRINNKFLKANIPIQLSTKTGWALLNIYDA